MELPVRTFSEWAVRQPSDVAPSQADWAALERLQEDADPVISVRRAAEAIDVSTYSWIGVIPLERVELRVTPKLLGGDLAVLTMLGYAFGAGSHSRVRKVTGAMSLPPSGTSLVDLVGTLLAQETETLIRQGLISRFSEREGALPYLRGRLLPLPQVQKHFGQVLELECRYEEFDSDVLENRWLATGIERALLVCRAEDVRQRLNVCKMVLTEACDPGGFDVESIAGFEYQRDNVHYKWAHEWASLFLRGQRLSRLFATGPRSFAFLLDMNVIFENFVSRLVASALEPIGIRVVAQRRDRSIIQWFDTGRPYQTVIPDLLAFRPDGVQIPIDAKYKLDGDRKIQPADVYQMFAYAYAYSDPTSAPNSVLIYPTEADTFDHSALLVRSHDATLRPARLDALGIPVARILGSLGRLGEKEMVESVRERLLALWSTPAAYIS